MRADLEIIQDWIATDSRTLDLGCGDGTLLHYLKHEKSVRTLGIEIDEQKFNTCVARGLSVIEHNLDLGLERFADKSFDTVVLSQTLQAVKHPEKVLLETLRVGKECIVAFPNFGHWRCRWFLSTKGRMPVSEVMPYTWYDTPNIHFCTIKDFELLCKELNIQILNKVFTSPSGRLQGAASQWPNLFGSTAIYHLSR